MVRNTRAFRAVKVVYYIISLLIAACIEFLSTRLAPSDPLKDLLHDGAIAIILAVIGVFLTSLTRRLLDSHAKEVGKATDLVGLWQRMGIANMVTEWQDIRAPTGAGGGFRNHLKKFHENSAWYIITINPVGFSGEFFDNVILPALEQGVKLKRSYVRLPEEDDADGKALRDWWASQYVLETSTGTPDFGRKLDYARRNLFNSLNQIMLLVQQKVEIGRVESGSFEIYESSVATTFLALLAVKCRDTSKASGGSSELVDWNKGIALVDPYIMFPVPGQHHWGMILTGPGEMYEQYAESIIRFFDVGVSAGYLHRVYPE